MPRRNYWRNFLIDVVLCSGFVFLILIAIVKISTWSPLQVLDPIGQALADTELTDLTFSRLREDPEIDTNILIVNFGNLPRAKVAEQIKIISQYKPKVIAIDAFYGNCPFGLTDSINCPTAYDTVSNMLLANAITNAGNVVLVTKLLQTKALVEKYGDVAIYDSLERSAEMFRKGAHEGYASLETDAGHQEDLKTCRRFNPKMMVNGEENYAFAVKAAMAYDSAKTKRFLERDNFVEVINYRGNTIDMYGASEYAGRYFALDWYQALDTNQFVPALIKDKVVLMGFLGGDFTDTSWDDKFLTPLNSKMAGRARPDMYGLVVHANIVSMILNEDYINETPDWLETVIAAVLCMLTVAVFLLINGNSRLAPWYDALSLVIQLSQILIFSFVTVFFVVWFRLKLDLTTSLAALAVVGTGFELYNSFIKALWKTYFSKFVKKYLDFIGFLSNYISIKRHE